MEKEETGAAQEIRNYTLAQRTTEQTNYKGDPLKPQL